MSKNSKSARRHKIAQAVTQQRNSVRAEKAKDEHNKIVARQERVLAAAKRDEETRLLLEKANLNAPQA